MEALTLGKTIEHNGIRFHRYASSIRATDLTNAGKRGKTVGEASYYHSGREEETVLDAMVEKLKSTANFEDVKKVFEETAEVTEYTAYELMTYKGVRVAPSQGDFKKIVLDSDDVYVEIDWDAFIIRDKRDRNNEPRLRSDKPTDAKRLHKQVSENMDKFKAFTFQDFHSFFTGQWDSETNTYCKNHVGFHYWCAMD